MTTMHFADTETMDDFLAQSGVKGMKWGVRKSESVSARRSTRSGRKPVGSPTLKNNARVSAKQVAWTVAKVGVPPLLIATGVGAPIAVSLGVSMRLLGDPAVKQALSDAGSYISSVKSDIGGIKMRDVTDKVGLTTNLEEFKKSGGDFKNSGPQMQLRPVTELRSGPNLGYAPKG